MVAADSTYRTSPAAAVAGQAVVCTAAAAVVRTAAVRMGFSYKAYPNYFAALVLLADYCPARRSGLAAAHTPARRRS